MLWIQLTFIVLLTGFIGDSYGYHRRMNHLRRRIRDTSLKDTAQQVLQKIFNDEERFENEVKDKLRKEEEKMKEITQRIILAAQKIAHAGTQDATSLNQWTTIQSDIRLGINVIIDAYRRYNKLNRDTCESIENFTNSMIEKYDTELMGLDQLSVPRSSNETMDINNSNFADFITRLYKMIMYGNVHGNTMLTSLDAVHDMISRTIQQRAVMMNPGIQRSTIPVDPSTNQEITVACSQPEEDNGNIYCPSSIFQITIQHLASACPAQCFTQQDS